jgi:hypothetical protein
MVYLKANLIEHQFQLAYRINRLASPVVVGEDEGILGLAIDGFDAGYPFGQLFFSVRIVITLIGIIVFPPFDGIPPVKAHIADIAGNHGYRRDEPGQPWLVNAAEADVIAFQPGVNFGSYPLDIAELYNQGQVVKPLAEHLNVILVITVEMEAIGELG